MREKYSNGKEEVVIYQILIKRKGKRNKKYVGVTKASPPIKRFNLHLKIANNIKHYKDKNKVFPLHYAIAKYGVENVKFSILEKVKGDFKYGLKREIYWINKLKTHISLGNGYNITWGGDGVPHSEEMKTSKSIKMRKRRDEIGLWNQILTAKQALEIKNIILSQTCSNTDIANKYKCSPLTVGQIARNEIYSDILKDTPILENGKNGWEIFNYKNRGGSKNPAAKFNDDQIREIRRLYNNGNGMRACDLAEKFSLSNRNMYRIIHYISYKDVK